jgi:hypothetical protein
MLFLEDMLHQQIVAKKEEFVKTDKQRTELYMQVEENNPQWREDVYKTYAEKRVLLQQVQRSYF